MSDDSLPMDPMMEAFFIAVALELGTRTSPDDHLAKRKKMGLPLTHEEATTMWRRALDRQSVAAFMKEHPGAPPMFEKLKRMHYEISGGANRAGRVASDYFFWDKLAEAYGNWCRNQSPTD